MEQTAESLDDYGWELGGYSASSHGSPHAADSTMRFGANSMADAAGSPIIWVSPDNRTAHFLRPHERPNRRACQRFSLLGMRLVRYCDGCRAHTWCSDSEQHECDPAEGENFGDSDRLSEPRSWGNSMQPCAEGAHMISYLGRRAAARPALQPAAQLSVLSR